MFGSHGFAHGAFASAIWAGIGSTPDGAGELPPELPGGPPPTQGQRADDYVQLLLQLLPDGPAWPKQAGSSSETIYGTSGRELAALHERVEHLIEEADPRTTSELLVDWERVVGLPDPCLDPPSSTAERRRRVVQRLTSQGGQSVAFFVGLLEAFGFPGATVTEFRPMRCNSKANAAINQGGWRFGWRVNLPSAAVVQVMTCTGRCTDPLASWGDPGLECLIATHKPAHTRLLVAYED